MMLMLETDETVKKSPAWSDSLVMIEEIRLVTALIQYDLRFFVILMLYQVLISSVPGKSHSKENPNSCTGTESSEKNVNRLWHSNAPSKFS